MEASLKADAAAPVPAPILHGGGVTEAARAYGGTVADWLDLSTGINPNPVALPAIPMDAWHRLPDRHLADAARLAASAYYGAVNCLPLPAPGTQSVIQHLPKLAPQGRRVAVLSPTYGEYVRVLSAAGLAVDRIETLDAVTADHGLVVVVNPNNPTGRVWQKAELAALAGRLAANGARLHVDEAFADGGAAESMAPEAGRAQGLTVFRSFGKFFGLAGLRLGFVLGSEADLSRFADWLGPWPVSGPALVIAERLMRSDLSGVRARIAERHEALLRVLERAGLAVVGGSRLFVLVDHPQADRLHDHLCRNHILVRKFDYNGRWLRFGLAPDAAADTRLLKALEEFAA
ncbi:threonine-phosphate decarboxylase CobD [Gellertiella hungarica]|uniref:threonine-phosphate decarboxylase n=1 Tax=Gellertiella hungarica TaxID=1572859 RepID=A0A7W6J8Z8_9HYPH|nr:cobalamin biosynthetic protein CobC [Gellertiella hungarica]